MTSRTQIFRALITMGVIVLTFTPPYRNVTVSENCTATFLLVVGYDIGYDIGYDFNDRALPTFLPARRGG